MTHQASLNDERVDRWISEVKRLTTAIPDPEIDSFLRRVPNSLISDCSPAAVADDIEAIHHLGKGAISVHIYSRNNSDDDGRDHSSHHVRIRTVDTAAPLHRVLPILQSMGIDAVDERPYLFDARDGHSARIYDLTVTMPTVMDDSVAQRDRISNAFRAAWLGQLEIDAFNNLVLTAGLTWNQVIIIRAYAAYIRQAALPYTPSHIQSVLASHPEAATTLVTLFETKFDPESAHHGNIESAHAAAADVIETVSGLDADRILQALLAAVRATVRTNLYGPARPSKALSVKLDASAIDFLPKPRPLVEVFVYGPTVRGVHMRFDSIARGGIRFSDRADDYRTEILGLAKAQSVKNSVIVPGGAKGGFVLPQATVSREQAQSSYREFITSLLDLTDNLDVRINAAVPPPGVIRRDGDDTYLVVAADKGTASFSDTANAVALERGYWLGDAFASGGTNGYDHKAMGITARGAWESVRRHFRDLGIDIDTDVFTAVGIGDMSGDVFGNGMLLSNRMLLKAAFDHRHIFIDPDPDVRRAHTERQRLFELPRSTWSDYDRAVLSPGGLIAPRDAKSVVLTPQVRSVLGIDPTVERMSAQDLVRAILTARVDLLWNGGIGTYVKSSTEMHANCGDKANDGVRVNANQLRTRVVGEGGNLGLTQRGRIEFARLGGRINTDALDNAGGVDCSDHEVNIKIALETARRAGTLADSDRVRLLAAMTGQIAASVLARSKRQNDALGVSRHNAAVMIGFHARVVDELEADGIIDRDVDTLPTVAQFAALQSEGHGLSSPELSQLTAQVKNGLRGPLLGSTVPDEPTCERRLDRYFPATLLHEFQDAIRTHPLKREIATSELVNSMVEYGGITFVSRLRGDTATTVADCARAFEVVSEVFDLADVYSSTYALDDVPVEAVDALVVQTQRLLDRACRWLLTRRSLPLDVASERDRYRYNIHEHGPTVRRWLRGDELEAVERRTQNMVFAGAPAEHAARVADLLHIFCFFDITDLASTLGQPFSTVAELYFAASAQLHINTHLTMISGLDRHDRWNSLARLALREDLYTSLQSITADIAAHTPASMTTDERIRHWEHTNASTLESARTLLEEATAATGPGGNTLANLCVAARQIKVMGR